MPRFFTPPVALRNLLWSLLVVALTVGLGCDRSPEDLEEWRTARGGIDQLAEWAKDGGEPMEVRVRAVQIIIEEGEDRFIPRILDEIDDEQARQQITTGAMETVREMWEVQDFPEVDEELLEEGGEIALEGLNSIYAIESLYRLMPYLDDEQQEVGQEILRDWISRDQMVRNQWADVGIPLLVPLAGEGATELVSNWILDSNDPRSVAASLRRHAPDGTHGPIDEAVVELAREQHPNVEMDLKHAINGAESDAIVPYLEEVIVDEEVSNELFQIAIDTIADVLDGEDAAGVLSTVVKQRPGVLRWAAATAILDAREKAGLKDIAKALPGDDDAFGSEDEFNQRATYLCNYVNTHVERGDFEEDYDTLVALLEMEHWPAQTLGLQCAARLGAKQLREDVEALSGQSGQIHGWGQRLTIGQFADHVAENLDVADDD